MSSQYQNQLLIPQIRGALFAVDDFVDGGGALPGIGFELLEVYTTELRGACVPAFVVRFAGLVGVPGIHVAATAEVKMVEFVVDEGVLVEFETGVTGVGFPACQVRMLRSVHSLRTDSSFNS